MTPTHLVAGHVTFFAGHVTGANGRGSLAGSTQKRAWRQNNNICDCMYVCIYINICIYIYNINVYIYAQWLGMFAEAGLGWQGDQVQI